MGVWGTSLLAGQAGMYASCCVRVPVQRARHRRLAVAQLSGRAEGKNLQQVWKAQQQAAVGSSLTPGNLYTRLDRCAACLSTIATHRLLHLGP